MNYSAAILWWPPSSDCAFKVVQSVLRIFPLGMTAVNYFVRCLGTAWNERNGSGEKLLHWTPGQVLPSSKFLKKKTDFTSQFFGVGGGNCVCCFETFAVFWMLYAFFWVIPRRLDFICRRFWTLCLFHLHRWIPIFLWIWNRMFRNVGI